MNASEQLRAIRKSKGMTQQEFAAFMEMSLSAIANIENGSREISKAMMKSIIEKCDINARWLLTGEGEMFEQPAKEPLPANESVRIPILSQKVSCGRGESWESEQNITEYISLSSLSPALKGRVYGFRVAGTSMLGAGIKDGDIVIFDSSSGQDLADGIYVFSLDGDAYCKRLEFDRLANRIKIYSVRVADLEKAELLKTLDSTDEGFSERFRLFGRVFSWVHVISDR